MPRVAAGREPPADALRRVVLVVLVAGEQVLQPRVVRIAMVDEECVLGGGAGGVV